MNKKLRRRYSIELFSPGGKNPAHKSWNKEGLPVKVVDSETGKAACCGKYDTLNENFDVCVKALKGNGVDSEVILVK